MIIVYFLLAVSGSFFVNHLVMRSVSGRDLTRADAMMFVWCFLYLGYLFAVIAATWNTNGPQGMAGLVVSSVLQVGIPALITAAIAWRVWRRLSPGVSVLVAAVIISVLPAIVPTEIWFIGAPIIWNAAYAGACVPITLGQRRTDEYARTARCDCGYPTDGLPPGSVCPECGRDPGQVMELA
jgi:hypothetical protein